MILQKISCLITDVIKETLASCDYTNCDQICADYLVQVLNDCHVVFHNQIYGELWNTLFRICAEGQDESLPAIH
jgi:hypothetical protein